MKKILFTLKFLPHQKSYHRNDGCYYRSPQNIRNYHDNRSIFECSSIGQVISHVSGESQECTISQCMIHVSCFTRRQYCKNHNCHTIQNIKCNCWSYYDRWFHQMSEPLLDMGLHNHTKSKIIKKTETYRDRKIWNKQLHSLVKKKIKIYFHKVAISIPIIPNPHPINAPVLGNSWNIYHDTNGSTNTIDHILIATTTHIFWNSWYPILYANTRENPLIVISTIKKIHCSKVQTTEEFFAA